MTPRWATFGVFFVHGAVAGTWITQIPWIQERFELSRSAIGLVLVGMSLAVVLAFPVAGQAVGRHGSETMTRIGAMACALSVNLAVLAPHEVLVAAGLFVLGAASATLDVSMNSHGVRLEQHLGRPVMSSLHAGWSLGGMTGAVLAALLTGAGVDARAAVGIASALLVVLVLVVTPRIGPGAVGEGKEAPAFALPSRGVLLLAVLCFLVMVTEGAMADWGGLYLRQDLGTSAALAALAFAAFTAGLTVGRVAGDAVNARIGPVALLRWGALLTGLPLAAMLLVGAPAAALACLFLIGVGLANGVPLMVSAAGRQPDALPGAGIAAVSSMGSLGFLAGPPVIGFLADATSLPWALSSLALGAVAVFALARRATSRGRPEAARTPQAA